MVCEIECSAFVAMAGREGFALPGKIDIEAPPGKTLIVMRLDRYRLNTRLSPGLFNFNPPPGVLTRPIEEFGK